MPTPAEIQQLRLKLNQRPEQQQKAKKLWILAAIVAILLICLGSVLAILTPKKVTITTTPFFTQNMDASQTKLVTVKFTGQAPQLPPQLPIAQATSGYLPTADIITSLIKKYDLTRVSPDSEYWTSDRSSLGKDKYNDVYTLVTSQFDPSEKLPIVQKDTAVQAAQSFLAQTLAGTTLSPLVNSVSYVDYGQEAAETTPEKATAITVSFAPMIQNLPIYYKNQTAAPFLVTVDGNNSIRKVVFLPQFQTYTTVDQTKPISIDEAITQITAGNGSIIDATYTADPVQLSALQNAELTTVTLEYREDANQQLVFPFYHFVGKATTASHAEVDVQIITPAVKVSAATGRK